MFKLKKISLKLMLVLSLVMSLMLSTISFADTNIAVNATSTNGTSKVSDKKTEPKIKVSGKEYTLPEFNKEFCSPKSTNSNITTNKTINSATSSMDTYIPIVDGQTLNRNLSSMGTYTIQVGDFDERFFTIQSSGKSVQAILCLDNNPNFCKITTGDYKYGGTQIAAHLIPGYTYTLYVSANSYPANVTISMGKKGDNLTWGTYPQKDSFFQEVNVLWGGQTEQYGLSFDRVGRYTVTISAGNDCSTAILMDTVNSSTKTMTFGPNGYTFDDLIVTTPTGESVTRYRLILTNNDSSGSGSAYNISITRNEL